mmetsp:Transcript_15199/g.32469  ORF Transcript_15199/g.32469 Transcript_15199/m.32469 type:complete len:136 (+) Transcript_15199:152-559(+)
MAAKNWDKCVHLLIGQGKVLTGAVILPIMPDSPGQRKSVIHAQKGISLKTNEATALVEAVMDGRLHKDYVYAGGHQYIITTVLESSYHGRCLSTATAAGVVVIKTDQVLLLATYAEPVTAAEAIPYTHNKVELLK